MLKLGVIFIYFFVVVEKTRKFEGLIVCNCV